MQRDLSTFDRGAGAGELRLFPAMRRRTRTPLIGALCLIVALAPGPAANTADGVGTARLTKGAAITEWLLLGPIPLGSQAEDSPSEAKQREVFATDALAKQGGEVAAHPSEGDTVPEISLRWKRIRSSSGSVDLAGALGAGEARAAYAFSAFVSPRHEKTLLGVGSDDAVKVWLNGKVVLDRWVNRQLRKDDDLAPVELNKGVNRLLLKVQNGSGDWGFTCRFLGSRDMAAPLVVAAMQRDKPTVSRLLASGVEANAKAGPDLSAWQAAIIRGREDIARLLAAKGARTNLAFPRPAATVEWIITNRVRADGPGLALSVVKDGTVILKKGWGLANLEYGVPIQPNTVFHVASVSKQFTAFAAALLEDEGRLSLEEDIRKHLPNVPDFGKRITARHLLNHTSGLRDQWDLWGLSGRRMGDIITQQDLVASIERQKELNFAPGEEHLYCNSGYTLVAELVAKVSGQPFCDFTHDRIFKPLGMNNTHFHMDLAMVVPNMAYSYEPRAAGGFSKSTLSYANVGATSLFTTVEDLARWIANFERPKVGNPRVLDRMREKGKLNNGSEIGYGLGLAIGDYRKARVVEHGGGDAGYRTYVLWFPDQHLGVVVLSNLGTMDPGGIAHEVAEVYLRGQLASAAPPEAPEAKPAQPVKVDTTAWDTYLGTYRLRPGWLLTISREGDQLMTQATREPKFKMTPEADNRFFVEAYGASIEFLRDGSGPVQRIVYRGIRAPRVRFAEVTPAYLAAFAGDYWSEELRTLYRLELRDGRLLTYYPPDGWVRLNPTEEDAFSIDSGPGIEFTRNAASRVTEMKLSTGRVRNLRLKKTVFKEAE